MFSFPRKGEEACKYIQEIGGNWSGLDISSPEYTAL